jgi:hypothetical protein
MVTSFEIKNALMYYYRFKRQMVCADEVGIGWGEIADVVVDTEKDIVEIEVKTSKSDLFTGESRKKKHKVLNDKRLVNRFFICVPSSLLEDAKVWVEQTNPKYGIIEYIEDKHYRLDSKVFIHKKALPLHERYSGKMKERILFRLCSALIMHRIGQKVRNTPMPKVSLPVEEMTEEQAKKVLMTLIEKLDELDQEDFFGTEGWKHMFGLED